MLSTENNSNNDKLLLLLLLTVNIFINGKWLFLKVNDFINGKWYSWAVLYKDDIALHTCDHSFLNFLRCISQSRIIKQTWKISFLEKLEMERQLYVKKS